MQNQAAGAPVSGTVDENVLAATRDARDASAGDARGQIERYRPAQLPLAHAHAGDDIARKIGLDAAAGNFDFG